MGVNSYKLKEDDQEPIKVLTIDNTRVRESQISKLVSLRKTRDQAATQTALDALTECCRSGQGNLLELSVRAAR